MNPELLKRQVNFCLNSLTTQKQEKENRRGFLETSPGNGQGE